MYGTLSGTSLTVSCCVAEVSPEAEAVRVGVPTSVSLYLKLALLLPARIVTPVIVAVSAVLRNTPPAEVVPRLTASPPLPAATGLPDASSNCTVIVSLVPPAVSVCGLVVKPNWLAGTASTVSCCVAEESSEAEAVSIGVPTIVSLYLKLAVLLPAGIVTLVIVAVSDVLRNTPPAELVPRLTASPPLPAATALPDASSNCTVIVPLVTPAVSVCALVVKANWLATSPWYSHAPMSTVPFTMRASPR